MLGYWDLAGKVLREEGGVGALRELWVGCKGKVMGYLGESKGQPWGMEGTPTGMQGESGLGQGDG